jgi:hypothetical protein
MMSLESILGEVHRKRPDLGRLEARAVATDIFYSGEPASHVLASDETTDRLVAGYKARLAGSQSVAASDPATCPVCKAPLKPVKLANDRDAVYCSKHFVVFPVKPKEK